MAHTINPTTTSAWKTGIALPRNAKCVYARNVSVGCKQDKFNLKWNDFTGLFKT
jgi:hypothetical protein